MSIRHKILALRVVYVKSDVLLTLVRLHSAQTAHNWTWGQSVIGTRRSIGLKDLYTHQAAQSSICWQITTSLQSLYTLPSHDSDARSWFRPVVSGNADIYQRFNASVKYLDFKAKFKPKHLLYQPEYLDFKAKFKPKRLLYQPEYLRLQSQIQAQALTLSTQVLRLQSQIQAQALTLSTRVLKTSKPNSSPSAYFINPST